MGLQTGLPFGAGGQKPTAADAKAAFQAAEKGEGVRRQQGGLLREGRAAQGQAGGRSETGGIREELRVMLSNLCHAPGGGVVTMLTLTAVKTIAKNNKNVVLSID